MVKWLGWFWGPRFLETPILLGFASRGPPKKVNPIPLSDSPNRGCSIGKSAESSPKNSSPSGSPASSAAPQCFALLTPFGTTAPDPGQASPGWRWFQWPFSGTDWLEVPTIYKAYVFGLCKGIYSPSFVGWLYMVQYLQFRNLKWQLMIYRCTEYQL